MHGTMAVIRGGHSQNGGEITQMFSGEAYLLILLAFYPDCNAQTYSCCHLQQYKIASCR